MKLQNFASEQSVLKQSSGPGCFMIAAKFPVKDTQKKRQGALLC